MWLERLNASFLREQQLGSKYAAWVQLANIDAQGRPAVRTIVFRGLFDPDHPTTLPKRLHTDLHIKAAYLLFCTDSRMDKVSNKRWYQQAELCWMMPLQGHQFRIKGHFYAIPSLSQCDTSVKYPEANIQIAHRDFFEQARLEMWNQLNEGIKIGFQSPKPNSELSQDLKPLTPTEAKEQMTLMVFVPDFVEFICLEVHEKDIWELSSKEWKHKRIRT